MKTNVLVLSFVLLLITTLSSCKKDYTCKAVSESGEETSLSCENCSKKDVEDYEKSILDAGYTSATCEK